MKASHDLWSALCSGHVYPAAEVALPFLVEILGIAQPAVQGEILDMLLKFSGVPNDNSAEDWQKNLHAMLQDQSGLFTRLSRSPDTMVADKARMLLSRIH